MPQSNSRLAKVAETSSDIPRTTLENLRPSVNRSSLQQSTCWINRWPTDLAVVGLEQLLACRREPPPLSRSVVWGRAHRAGNLQKGLADRCAADSIIAASKAVVDVISARPTGRHFERKLRQADQCRRLAVHRGFCDRSYPMFLANSAHLAAACSSNIMRPLWPMWPKLTKSAAPGDG